MTPRGERRHYLSKSCSTQDGCQKSKWTKTLTKLHINNRVSLGSYAYTPVCTRNWYDDWSCVECCKGDRCNKYVFVSRHLVSLVWFWFNNLNLGLCLSSAPPQSRCLSICFLRWPLLQPCSPEPIEHLFPPFLDFKYKYPILKILWNQCK